MPTGYTALIEDNPNCTFPQFALRCARAFGALIMLKDDSLDAPIPDAIEDDGPKWHQEQMERATIELAQVEAMTMDEWAARCDAKHDEAIRQYNEQLSRYNDLSQRYRAMLRQVSAWVPPTSEHQELKNFMEEQIEQELEYLGPPSEPVRGDTEMIRVGVINGLNNDIRWHEREYHAAVKRKEERQRWADLLRGSLKSFDPSAVSCG